MDDGTPESITLAINWAAAESLPVMFADQVLLQSQGGVVVMSVAQTVLPAVMGPDDPRIEQMKRLGSVEVRPLIRVAMTQATAARVAEAFRALAELGTEGSP